jgi:hypothetical protein
MFLTQALAFVVRSGFVCHDPTVLHCESTRAGNTYPSRPSAVGLFYPFAGRLV